MPKTKKKLLFLLIVVIILISNLTIFIVETGQNALLITLGKMAKNRTGDAVIFKPGLHVKLPFISHAKNFDMRLQVLPVDSARFLTKEQQTVLVDYYITWRIADLPRYFNAADGDIEQIYSVLQQKINDALAAKFSLMSLAEIIAADHGETQNLASALNEIQKQLGINVVNVVLGKVALPAEVNSAIFDRMRADEQQLATKIRSDANKAAENLKNAVDEKSATDLAQANDQAAQIQAAGDAAATDIYLAAYGKNPQFFTLYNTLQFYKNVFNDKNTLFVLTPFGEFFNISGISK